MVSQDNELILIKRDSDEYWYMFEEWLNDQGLNNNNAQNEDKEEEFEEENEDDYYFID